MQRSQAKQSAWDATHLVLDNAAEQLEATMRLTESSAKKKRLKKGIDQIIKLKELALDIIDDFEDRPEVR